MGNKLKLIVSGNVRGRNFADVITFILYPPSGYDYYGNGYHMNVEIDGHPSAIHYVDVRYANTTNLEKLANIWIKDFYGNNVNEIKKLA